MQMESLLRYFILYAIHEYVYKNDHKNCILTIKILLCKQMENIKTILVFGI